MKGEKMNGTIQSVQEAPETLASNTDAIKFADTDLRTASANCFNGWLNHNEGTAQFTILSGGIYEINFNTNITSSTAGVVGLALFADGVQLNGSEVDQEVVTANTWKSVAFTKKIRVCNRGSVTLTVRSVPTIDGTATQIPIVKNANISIERLA
jgi:hypothetical protein